MDRPPRQRFARSGVVTGVFGTVFCLVLAATGLVVPGAAPDTLTALALVGAGVCWVNLVRPRVSIVGSALELRHALSTVTIPLVLVEEVLVQQMLVVRTETSRYVSAALGRSRRQIDTDARRAPALGAEGTVGSYGYLAEYQLAAAVQRARASAPDDVDPPPVVRTWNRIDLATLAGALLAAVLVVLV